MELSRNFRISYGMYIIYYVNISLYKITLLCLEKQYINFSKCFSENVNSYRYVKVCIIRTKNMHFG